MGFTTAPGRVSKTDFLGFQAGEAQPASQAASRPASQPASQPAGRTFCHEGGTPKGSRGPPGTALGQSVARWCNLWSFSITFLGTFWHPGRQGGHPGRSRGVPLGTFCITFVPLFAISAPGTSLWVAQVFSRRPPGGENVGFTC